MKNRALFYSVLANRPRGLALETGRCSTQPDAVQQFATAEGTLLSTLGANLTTVAAGVLSLLTQINNSGPTFTQADQAALDNAITQTQALVTQSAAISTVAPATAPPASS